MTPEQAAFGEKYKRDITPWYRGTRDPDRGLLNHHFNRYSTRFVKSEFATNQGDDLDAKAKAA
jgi:hypothetical protein